MSLAAATAAPTTPPRAARSQLATQSSTAQRHADERASSEREAPPAKATRDDDNDDALAPLDLNAMPLRVRCEILRAVERGYGAERRNVVAQFAEPLLAANRHFFVTSFTLRRDLPTPHLVALLRSYSSLRTARFSTARTLPANFARVLLRRRLECDDDNGDDDARDRDLNRGVLATMRELGRARTYVNPIEHIAVCGSDELSNADVASLHHFVFVHTVVLRALPRLTNFSFLHRVAFPRALRRLDVAHCENLRSNRVALRRDVLERVHDKHRASRRNALDYIRGGDASFDAARRDAHLYENCDARYAFEAKPQSGDDDDDGDAPGGDTAKFVFDYADTLRYCTQLTVLSLTRCASLDAAVLATVARHANISTLSLHSCEWLQDAHMLYVRRMVNLRRLSVANCQQLTKNALIVLCYVTRATLAATARHLQREGGGGDGAAQPAATPSVSDDAAAADDDDDDDAELCRAIEERVVRPFFDAYGDEIRVDVAALLRDNVLRCADEIEALVPPGFLPLSHLDVSYCRGASGIDLRLFSTLVALDELRVDGCSLFADHHDVDQAVARHYADGTDAQLAALVARLADTRHFDSVLGSAWRAHTLNARTLSMNACTITARRELCDGGDESVAEESAAGGGGGGGGSNASEDERREVCAAFKLLFLKHATHVRTLTCAKMAHVLDERALCYAALFMPALEELSVAACDGVTDAALAHLSCVLRASNRALRTLMLDSCPRVTDVGVDGVLRTFAASLERFSVHDCALVTNYAFRNARHCARLADLDVSRCRDLSHGFLTNISRGDVAHTLQRLNLGGTAFEPKSLFETLSRCTALVFIGFDTCAKVDDSTLLALHASLPSLRAVSVRKTPCVSKSALVYLSKHPKRPIEVVE